MPSVEILAISGSLRAASANSAVLRAAASLSPGHARIQVYRGLGDLPHFNPDLDGRESPAVLGFRRQLRDADGVLIACPEYAHGLPGAFKNALDWVVGSGELVDKPVALVNLLDRSTWAPALLKETLAMMNAKIVEPFPITLGLPGNAVSEDFVLTDARIAQALRDALNALVHAIEEHKAGT
jgi:chromate reductase